MTLAYVSLSMSVHHCVRAEPVKRSDVGGVCVWGGCTLALLSISGLFIFLLHVAV